MYNICQIEMIAHEHQRDQEREALRLYHRSYCQGWVSKVWAVLTRQSRALLDLNTVKANCPVVGQHYIGLQTVSVSKIRGSEGRCHDFDAAFHPLQRYTTDRWQSIATAWQLGVALPAVDLIEVGDVYFVRDGHHRVSVARALGQQYIDAIVTSWQVGGRLPWERRLVAPNLK